MEDEKKKKKSKKKKNKQSTKLAETVTLDSRESGSNNRRHDPKMGQDEHGQRSGSGDASDDIGVNKDTDTDGAITNDAQDAHLTNSEKQHWLDREASFQERIEHLQVQNDAKTQKETHLANFERQHWLDSETSFLEKIEQLQAENDAKTQKEAILEEKIKELLKEKYESSQKQDNLEEKIKQLQREKDSYLQIEAGLEMKILELESEKSSWLKREIGLEEKINLLMDETAELNLKVVSLQEKIKQMDRERDSQVQNENSARELVVGLNDDKFKLQAQVTALTQSMESLLEEKQQLTENISCLQSQIRNLEKASGPRTSVENKMISQYGDVDYESEASRTVVDKLIIENSELVGKVNELHAELDRRALKTEDALSLTSNPGTRTTDQPVENVDVSAPAPDMGVDHKNGTVEASDSTTEASNMMTVSGPTLSLDPIMIEDHRNGRDVGENLGSRPENTLEINEDDEIVRISLDGNEVPETNLEVAQNDEDEDVHLIDAPLIGAPFRLISFFARYVSGADLVNKNTRNTGY